ncbi:ATP-binding cassette domain-containing protein [Actinomyces qiguomingii]|uniref:ABC transporter ATP-binding protein/permease n=1 Tax=Actinomyces qiguomingii TaxID=2057800 RepID=UPI000CA0834E|nr:ATP-binding cassette domain-containing protein [Actinomyces qiguomingii]
MAELRLRGVGKIYGGEVPLEALRDVTLTIRQGEFISIQGPSGAGKSTLLNQLALLDTPTSGDYRINDVDVGRLSECRRATVRSENFAFVFQSFHLLKGRSLVENVALGLLYRGLDRQRRVDTAQEALAFVGLQHKRSQKVEKLSGGERQRAAIARAVASGAPVIVADEPTGNLDSRSSEQIMELLAQLNRRGATVIVVTHDDHVASYASRHLRVVDGRVEELNRTAPHASEKEPSAMRGRASRLRLPDALSDVWHGLRARRARSAALVACITLAVALATTTTGLSTTARFQVSDVFDSRRNQLVGLAAATTDVSAAEQALSADSAARIRDLAGVRDFAVLATHSSVEVASRPSATTTPLQLIGNVSEALPQSLFTVTSPQPLSALGEDEAILGSHAAQSLQIGPLIASPVIWLDGRPRVVVGILTDAGLDVGLLDSVIVPESEAVSYSQPQYASVKLRVAPGAAQQVAQQAPVAWIPSAPQSVTVDAPPDPMTLRAEVEDSIRAVLYTLTAVAAIAALTLVTALMISTVMERTGEIGLRRAMGARRVHIRFLIAAEATVAGLLGGVAGVYLGMMSILVITIGRGWQPVMDWDSVPLGIAGGLGVSLLGAVFATRRAAGIEPAEALHH